MMSIIVAGSGAGTPVRAKSIRSPHRLGAARGPVVAVSDFMKLVPDQIARWVPQGLLPLGTDGFGLSLIHI